MAKSNRKSSPATETSVKEKAKGLWTDFVGSISKNKTQVKKILAYGATALVGVGLGAFVATRKKAQ